MPSQNRLSSAIRLLYLYTVQLLHGLWKISKFLKKMLYFIAAICCCLQGLESAIKLIVKKFPIMEIKSHSKELAPVNNIKADVIKALSLYYYTFVDLLDFKVRVEFECLS